jgi:hypothetical protein
VLFTLGEMGLDSAVGVQQWEYRKALLEYI